MSVVQLTQRKTLDLRVGKDINRYLATVCIPRLLNLETPQQTRNTQKGALLRQRLTRADAAAPAKSHVSALGREGLRLLQPAIQESLGVEAIGVREVVGVAVDGPHVALHPGAFGDEPAVVLVVGDGGVRLAADDGDAAPAKHLLDEGVDVRQVGLVVERGAARRADHAVQLLPGGGEHVWECAAREHEGDEGRRRRVGAGAEQVAREGRDLLGRQVVFGRGGEELFGVALVVAGRLERLFGQAVEEDVIAAFAPRAEPALPGGDFRGEFGEDCCRLSGCLLVRSTKQTYLETSP